MRPGLGSRRSTRSENSRTLWTLRLTTCWAEPTIPSRRQFVIVYATHTGSEGFERFSVGHELGHYFLDGHIDHVLPKNGIHTSYGGFVSADPYELEADHYSAGLLMPGALFAKAVNKCKPGLETVEFMAGLCKTSLTATPYRCHKKAAPAAPRKFPWCRMVQARR
jgi:IrrE N-terminal-like domain